MLRQALAMADAEMAGLLTAEPTPELAVRIRQAVAESDPSPGVALRLAVAGDGCGRHAAGGARGVFWRAALRRHRSHAWPLTRAGRNRPAALARLESCPVAGRIGARVDALSPRGAPVRPGDEGSAVPADPSGPGRPESLGMTGRPSPRSSSRPARREALLRFAAQLQRRAVAPDSLLVADLSAPLAEPRAVEIAPLEIIPLDPAETSGTD